MLAVVRRLAGLALVPLALALGASPARAAVPGSLVPAGCILAYADGCTTHPDSGTEGNYAILVTRDGKHAYQLAEDCDRPIPCNNPFDSIIRYSRNAGTGALTPLPGRFGGWTFANSIAASPDSKHLYVFHGADPSGCGPDGYDTCPGGITVLQRNTTSGILTVRYEVTPRSFLYSGQLEVSPDGKDVYVLGSGFEEPVLAHFRRNATTGHLTQPAGTAGCVNHSGTDGCLAARLPRGDLEVTNVAAFVTGFFDRAPVFGDGVPALAAFRRSTTSGTLTQDAGAKGCMTMPAVEGCGDATGLGDSNGATMDATADGRHLYVSPLDVLGVQHFTWTSAAGLEQVAGGCAAPRDRDGCGAADPDYHVGGQVALAPDGRHLYLLTQLPERELTVFARTTTTGALTQLAGADGCVNDAGTGGCAVGPPLGPGVVVTPDNRSVYTNGALFRRVR